MTFSIIECSIDDDNYISLRLRHHQRDLIVDMQMHIDDASATIDEQSCLHYTNEQFNALI